MSRSAAANWVRSLHPAVKLIGALAAAALTLLSQGAKFERLAASPVRIDELQAAEAQHRAFHDTARDYMARKDARDDRILCLLQAIADDTSPLPCERSR